MDRTFDLRLNEIIVEKAISWAGRGVVGVDIAGPRPEAAATTTRRSSRWSRPPATPGSASPSTSAKRAATWGATRSATSSSTCGPIASGTGSSPRRTRAHGGLRDLGITLEICPTSNLLTKALPDEDAVRESFRTFAEHEVPFTIATDGPEMMRTHLRDEFELLLRIGALDEDGLREANARGHAAAFRRTIGVAAPA